jgi:hypothetical protein
LLLPLLLLHLPPPLLHLPPPLLHLPPPLLHLPPPLLLLLPPLLHLVLTGPEQQQLQPRVCGEQAGREPACHQQPSAGQPSCGQPACTGGGGVDMYKTGSVCIEWAPHHAYDT